jgi:hypothetical protein
MSGKNAVITVDAAKAAGVAVKAVASNLKSLADREAVEGALAISFERIALTSQMRQILDRPEVEAMILHAGRDLHTYEIAEMRDRSMPDQVVVAAAKQALLSGYLLADAAGPHFTIIAGKGAQATAMIKEAGHRYKLAQAGCTDIRVVSCSLGMRQRPNAAGKYDMLVAGTASCVHNGKPVQIERPRDMPYTLPCYESDGPDGHEAKARRRLLRDLWCAVSGEFALNSEDEIEQPTVQVVDSTPPRIAEQQISPQALYDGTRSDCVAYAAGIKAADERLAFQSVLDLIEAATDAEELRAKKDSDIVPVLRQLGVKRATGEMVVRMMDQRCAVLEATT